MSRKVEHPSQLNLPFFEDSRECGAKIFTFSAYRQIADAKMEEVDLLKKEVEKKILDRVLERAERLGWYK